MPFRVSPTDPIIGINVADFEIAFASILKAQGITTQAAFITAVNAATDTQIAAFVRSILKATIKIES